MMSLNCSLIPTTLKPLEKLSKIPSSSAVKTPSQMLTLSTWPAFPAAGGWGFGVGWCPPELFSHCWTAERKQNERVKIRTGRENSPELSIPPPASPLSKLQFQIDAM